jgi:Membrane protein TerC, possibly involved in tellurium resistance
MDSVLTAVGLTQDVPVMVAAIITAAIIMMIAAEPVNNLVSRYPGFKTLAFLFLVLLGMLLMAEGTGIHINKGYVYVAMAFGLILELCHIRLRNKQRLNIKRIGPHFSLKCHVRLLTAVNSKGPSPHS